MILLELAAESRFGRRADTHPRVFLVKSAQAAENNGDTRNCELKRVRKLLKTKDRVFGVLIVGQR